jgi:hypothetical protein
MKIEEMKSNLAQEQNAFATHVKEPNTLERNLVLAKHRTEIARLEKLIAKNER